MKDKRHNRFALFCAIMAEAESETGIMLAVSDEADIYLVDKNTGKKKILTYRKTNKRKHKK